MDDKMITVAGITFSAEDIVSAVIKKDGRKIVIEEKSSDDKKIEY